MGPLTSWSIKRLVWIIQHSLGYIAQYGLYSIVWAIKGYRAIKHSMGYIAQYGLYSIVWAIKGYRAIKHSMGYIA